MAFAPERWALRRPTERQDQDLQERSVLSTPFLSITTESSTDRGVLGIAFDPQFTTNHYVYVYYHPKTTPIHGVISRFVVNGDVG